MDYVMYTVDEDLAVGELMEQHASKTPEECMAACATNGCELVSLALPNMPDIPGLVSVVSLQRSGWCLLHFCCCSRCHHLQCRRPPDTHACASA
jgi:hypothetical protein